MHGSDALANMDININVWLKDHLGLHTFSENDLSAIIYHPKHGALCRRFLKFLSDTTLSSRKYPNVYAKEDLENARSELAARRKQLSLAVNELETYTREIEQRESHLNSLRSKLEHLKILDSMQRTSIDFNEQILERNNIFSRHLTKDGTFDASFPTSNLSCIYTMERLAQVETRPICMKERSLIDEQIEDLVQNCDVVQNIVVNLIESIRKNSDHIQIPSSRPVVHLETLLALNTSPFKSSEVKKDEQQSNSNRPSSSLDATGDILDSICTLRKEVNALMEKYETARKRTDNKTIERLRKCKQQIEALAI